MILQGRSPSRIGLRAISPNSAKESGGAEPVQRMTSMRSFRRSVFTFQPGLSLTSRKSIPSGTFSATSVVGESASVGTTTV